MNTALTASTPAASRHIAIIDDDQGVRRALGRLVRAHSFPVQTYATGREFLDDLRAGLPGCLIVDVQMADITGLQLMHLLADRGLKIPTIFVTARDEPGVQRCCELTGAIAFLLKPVMGEPLLRAIRAALNN